MSDTKITRRRLLAGAGTVAGALTMGYLGKAVAQDATPVIIASPVGGATPSVASPAASPVVQPSGLSEWPFYGNTVEGAKFTTSGGINSGNVANLALAWSVPVDGPISSTPVIANGMVVIGSYDGKLRALDQASGGVVWTYDTGAKVQEPNLKIPLGITGSAAIVDKVVYVGDAAGKLHAVDATTGKAIWSVKPNTQKAASIWSSPVVSEGVVYLGVASVAKETGFRGVVVALNAVDGKKLWEYAVVPKGRSGGGVFAVPAIDPQRGLLFVGTQNSYSEQTTNVGKVTSIIALETKTGKLKWSFAGFHEGGQFGPADDVGFSASPNLFTAKIGGKERALVGSGQKNGVFHVLDRDTGKVVWEETISTAGFLGGMEGTSAVGAGVIVVPATEWTDPTSTDAKGRVQALDAATGKTLWKKEQSAPNPAPVAISNDVAFQAGFEGVLRGLALSDGSELFSYDLGASVSGGIAVAGDLVALGSGTPNFSSIIKEGNAVWAFRLSAAPAASPVASPIASPEVPTESASPAPTETATSAPTETATEAPTAAPTETATSEASPVIS